MRADLVVHRCRVRAITEMKWVFSCRVLNMRTKEPFALGAGEAHRHLDAGRFDAPEVGLGLFRARMRALTPPSSTLTISMSGMPCSCKGGGRSHLPDHRAQSPRDMAGNSGCFRDQARSRRRFGIDLVLAPIYLCVMQQLALHSNKASPGVFCLTHGLRSL
jgi:hypothetical protein